MNRAQIREAVVAALKSVPPETDPASLDDAAPIRDSLDLDSMDFLNALVALHDERQRAEALNSAAASADAALGRAQSLYDRGQIDLLPLLDAQRVRLSVRVGANDSNTQLLLDSVQLYKALGGGWEAFEPAATPTAGDAAHSPNS